METENATPNKDSLGNFKIIIATIISVITCYTAYRTSTLSDKVNSLKSSMEEQGMVTSLINDMTSDTLQKKMKTTKVDFIFLSLERYLRNTSEDGELKKQDKKMLVGFAQTLLRERINNSNSDSASTDEDNRIVILGNFLKEQDTAVYNAIERQFSKVNRKTVIPDQIIKSSDSLFQFEPISQPIDKNKAKSIGLIVNKTVYIQYSSRNNKHKIFAIQEKLKQKSFLVPGIENVKGNYKNTIRYFHDEDRSVANSVKEVLGDEFKLLRVYNFEKKALTGQVEVWINNNEEK